MGYVALDGKKLIPAPFIGINRRYDYDNDGATQLSKNIVFTINGKAVKGKGGFTHTSSGYPADDFTKEPLEDLLAKIEDLEELADSAEWVWLEIQPDPEASAPSTKWRVRVTDLQLPNEHWVNYSDYTMTCEGQVSESDHVSGTEETWELTLNEQPLNTYQLSHNVSCTSRAVYVELESAIAEGWKKAYDYVIDVMGGDGVDTTITQGDPGFALGASFAAYNHIITRFIDERAGVYRINETWVMAENPYHETQQITVSQNRDAYPVGSADVTIQISGEVIGFRQDDESGYDDALSQWTSTVEPGLAAKAAAKLPAGSNPLRDEPSSKQVTYNEITRTVSYNYTYDNGSGDCVEDYNISVSQSDSECPDITVTVSGSIQGYKTSSQTAWEKAQSCWSTLEPTLASKASAAYTSFGGTGSLRGPYNKQYGQTELNARITFSRTWIDRDNTTLHETTIQEQFDARTDAVRATVNGNISALCSDSYNDVLNEYTTNATEAISYAAVAALYSGYDALGPSAVARSVTYNERDRVISYSYTFGDRGDGGYDEDLSFSVEESSQNCGYQRCILSGSIQGKRTGGGSAWQNALARFNSQYAGADASLVGDYIDNGKRTAKRITYNEFNNRIQFQYTFTDEEENWIIDESVTDAWSGGDCGYATITKSGTVKGICTGTIESAYANALSGFNTDVDVSIPDGATYLNSKSVTHSKRQGKISYTFTYTNRPDPAMVDETITTEESSTDRADTLTYSGTITGYCTDVENPNIKYSNANTRWIQRAAEIESSIGAGYIEVRRSVGENKRQGTISYNIVFRENNGCIAGSLSESMTVTDEYATNVFAVVPVLGGEAVIQDKGGTNVKRRTVSISATFPVGLSCDTSKPSGVETLVNQQEPSSTVVMVERDTEAWDPLAGRYTRNKTWVYQDC